MVLVAPRLLIVINYFFCLFVRVFFFYVYLDCRLNIYIYIYSWTHAFIKSGAKGGELQQLSNIEYICDFEYMYIYIYMYMLLPFKTPYVLHVYIEWILACICVEMCSHLESC